MSKTLDKILMRICGIRDELLFDKARNSASLSSTLSRIKTDAVSKLIGINKSPLTIKAIAQLIEYTNNGFTEHVDLAQLIKDNTKKEVTLSDKRINDYSLNPLNTPDSNICGMEKKWGSFQKYDGSRTKKFSIFLDTPIALGLFYKGEPNAIIGFIAENRQTLMVHQIQGVRPRIFDYKKKISKKGSSRGLMPLNWEDLLVNCVEQLAKEMNFKKTAIKSGYNSKWFFPASKRILDRYDLIAEKLGYRQRSNQNWYKDI